MSLPIPGLHSDNGVVLGMEGKYPPLCHRHPTVDTQSTRTAQDALMKAGGFDEFQAFMEILLFKISIVF